MRLNAAIAATAKCRKPCIACALRIPSLTAWHWISFARWQRSRAPQPSTSCNLSGLVPGYPGNCATVSVCFPSLAAASRARGYAGRFAACWVFASLATHMEADCNAQCMPFCVYCLRVSMLPMSQAFCVYEPQMALCPAGKGKAVCFLGPRWWVASQWRYIGGIMPWKSAILSAINKIARYANRT